MSFEHGYKVGDGVNYHFNGDTYPGTVTKVTAKRIWVSPDKARGKGIFTLNAKKEERLFTLRADGEFRSAGHGTWTLGKGREMELSREF